MAKLLKSLLSFAGLSYLLGILVFIVCIALFVSFGTPKNLNELSQLATAVTGILTVATLLLTLYTVNLQRIEFLKSSRAQVRTMHSELLLQALNDPDLLAVWDSKNEANVDPTWSKQKVYITQILSHWHTLIDMNEITKERLELLFDTYMHSPGFQKYWSEVRDFRAKSAKTGTHSDKDFHELAERAYESILRSSSSNN